MLLGAQVCTQNESVTACSRGLKEAADVTVLLHCC